MSEKKKCINDFKQQLPARINELYKLAYRGNQRKNYPGCDIWQYVNEQLKTDIRANFNNIVVFITDGYMDFENPKHAINKGNLHTTTHFINKLQGPDWQKQADNDGYGILPIRYNWLNTRVVVAGINSKKVNNLTETDKLKYFWLKWLHDSGFGKADCIVMSSPGKMTLLIDEFFNQ